MGHVIEPASSGRAKCRGCGKPIAKGALRLGERLPNPYAEGEMTHWYHVVCAALKRPQPFLEALPTTSETIERRDWLAGEAQRGLDHRRLPRIDGAARAPTGRARCRSCRELIDKGAWRIALVFYEEGRFQPSGYIHARCSAEYFETTDILPRISHFSPDLTEPDLTDLTTALE